MKASLTKQGIADKYTFTRPVPVSVPKILSTFTAIKTVFSDPTHFKVPYGIKDPATSGGSILDCDVKTRHDADLALVSVFLCVLAAHNDTYRNITDLTCNFPYQGFYSVVGQMVWRSGDQED
jgi:hypothetical protein